MFRVQRYSVPSPPWRTRLTEVYVLFENAPLEEYSLPAAENLGLSRYQCCLFYIKKYLCKKERNKADENCSNTNETQQDKNLAVTEDLSPPYAVTFNFMLL